MSQLSAKALQSEQKNDTHTVNGSKIRSFLLHFSFLFFIEKYL